MFILLLTLSLMSLLCALVSVGWSIVFIEQYGPYNLFQRIAESVDPYPQIDVKDEDYLKTFRGNVYMILTCPYCLSFWLTSPIVFIMGVTASIVYLNPLMWIYSILVILISYGMSVLMLKGLYDA